MPTLKKPRGFEASNKTETVVIGGHEYTITNLLKGGIIKQTTILIAVDDVWREIDVLNTGADNADLKAFADHVELHRLTFEDFGIVTARVSETKDYNLKHDDYVALSEKYPAFNYVQIAKLDTYQKSVGRSGIYTINQDLKLLTERGITVNDWIAKSEADMNKIINKPNLSQMESQNRIIELTSYGLVPNPEGYYEGLGFSVSPESIEGDSEEHWIELMQRIAQADNKPTLTPATPAQAFEAPEPAAAEAEAVHAEVIPATEEPAAPAKKPVSLQTIGELKPERIADLVNLKAETETILKDNPIIEITDKATRDTVHKSVATVLKACTSLDGKTGVIANKNKYLKAFSNAIDSFIDPENKKLRARHLALKSKLDAWDSAEELRKQAIKKAELTKIKDRTDRLFAVPFTFNGTLYACGTVYVTPTQIEKATDAEFDEFVKQGEAVQATVAAAAEADKSKDAALWKAAETLAGFNGKSAAHNYAELTGTPYVEPVAETAEPVTQTEAAPQTAAAVPETTPAATQQTVSAAQTTAAPSSIQRFAPGTKFDVAHPDNKLLNKFDQDHADVISIDPVPAAYIKCREYAKYGMRLVADEIDFIMDDKNVIHDESGAPVKKSTRIAALCAIIKAEK